MLAWLGLVTILATLIAIMSGRISALAALVLIPIAAAIIGGFADHIDASIDVHHTVGVSVGKA